MPQPLIDALLQFLSDWVGFEVGSNAFYVVFGVTATVALIVGRLISGLFGSSKGIVRTFFALVLPLLAAIFGYVLSEMYALPHLTEYDWAPTYVPWVGFGLLGLLAALLFSGRCWELGRGLSLTVLVLTAAAGVGGYYGCHLVIDVMAHGEKSLDERNEQIREGIEKAN